MTTIVDALFSDIKDLESILKANNEISLASFSDSNLRKNLLLASASYYETKIQFILEEFAKNKSTNCRALVSFLKNKGIKRQYHTFFAWERDNANSFLGLFGEDFRDQFKTKIELNDGLKKSISAFIEIGRERNRLVHQDFGNYILEKTAQEIFDLHKKAELFVSIFETELSNAF